MCEVMCVVSDARLVNEEREEKGRKGKGREGKVKEGWF